ncbi:MAG TPA: hypothetical protein VJ715_13765 [Pyrinomonadaceae bacterium]|nr:hypothetical protein [Pyrinomonadaceae bacterium]
MGRRITFALALSVACWLLLAACGKKQSEAERRYADACVKYNKGESYRKICDCSAAIVAPKLTPGELNAYVNSVDLLGKPMTEESVAPLGFTLTDFTKLGQKRQDSFAEMRKTCGGEI